MEFVFHHVAETGSTMDLARKLAADAKCEALIVLADSQFSGRGRIEGRSWSDRPGSSLLFTLGLRNLEPQLAALPLRVGLGISDALLASFPGIDLTLKWPNDLMARHLSPASANPGSAGYRKLGGILCEASGDWFFAGVGINLRPGAYPDSLAIKATSVDEALGRTSGDCSLTTRKKLAFLAGESILARFSDRDWNDAYRRRLWALGEEVAFTVGHPLLEQRDLGTILGIDESGLLVLAQPEGGARSYASGEITGLAKA